MGQLRNWVHVADEAGEMHAFGPSDVVPDWAAAKITNPTAWVEGGAPEPANAAASSQEPTPPGFDLPPKGGAGSGMDAWLDAAQRYDVDVDDDATRDEVIAAVEAKLGLA